MSFAGHSGKGEVVAGEKQITRQSPGSPSAKSGPVFQVQAVVATPGLSAGKVVVEDECACYIWD